METRPHAIACRELAPSVARLYNPSRILPSKDRTVLGWQHDERPGTNYTPTLEDARKWAILFDGYYFCLSSLGIPNTFCGASSMVADLEAAYELLIDGESDRRIVRVKHTFAVPNGLCVQYESPATRTLEYPSYVSPQSAFATADEVLQTLAGETRQRLDWLSYDTLRVGFGPSRTRNLCAASRPSGWWYDVEENGVRRVGIPSWLPS